MTNPYPATTTTAGDNGWPDIPDEDVEDQETAAESDADGVESAADGDGKPSGSRARASKPRASSGRAGGDNRALIRRVAQKTVEIAEAPVERRKVLAGILGCGDDPVHLATEVMCASRGATAVVSDLEEIASSDPMEAGVLVASWDRPRSNALWGLLGDLGVVKGSRPPNDAKAAIAIAKAVLGLSDADRGEIESAVALARKS